MDAVKLDDIELSNDSIPKVAVGGDLKEQIEEEIRKNFPKDENAGLTKCLATVKDILSLIEKSDKIDDIKEDLTQICNVIKEKSEVMDPVKFLISKIDGSDEILQKTNTILVKIRGNLRKLCGGCVNQCLLIFFLKKYVDQLKEEVENCKKQVDELKSLSDNVAEALQKYMEEKIKEEMQKRLPEKSEAAEGLMDKLADKLGV